MNYQIKVGLPQTLAFNVLLFWLLASTQLFAAPEASNSGFMRHPPKALKEKFPMCDAFLKVTWIDKEKNIGYSRFDFYIGDKKSKKRAFALVHIDERYPRFDYDLEPYRKQGHLNEVFAMIKQGQVAFPASSLFIEGGNRPYFLQGNHDARLGDFPSIVDETGNSWSLSLTKKQQSVCIPYPDNQRMWIAEGKSLEHIDAVDDCGISTGHDYLTTDGNDIFFDNQCKLNEPSLTIIKDGE